MKVLIAGGTGFIGERLSEGALAREWEVYLLVRDAEKPVPRRLAEKGAHLIAGDLCASRSVQEVFARVRPSHYFHNAGWYELGIPARLHDEMWAVNVQGLANALDAAEQAQVEKIVVTSSTTALGDTGGELVDERFERSSTPNSWYEHCLHAAHHNVRSRIEAGQPILMGSPAQVIGPGDHSVFGIMLRLYLRRLLPPTLWAPQGAFSFAHVEDVAEGLLRIMEAGRTGENYFLAGSIMTNREMIACWNGVTGRSFPVIWLPRGLANLTGQLAAPLLRFAGQPAFISPEVVRSSYVSFRYSDSKARSELGVSMRPAEDGWTQTIAAESA